MITSTHNRHVRYCRSLHRSRTRRQERAFLVEGIRLTREVLDADASPALALYDPEALKRHPEGQEILRRLEDMPQAFAATPTVIEAAAETQSPAGVVLVLPEPEPPDPSLLEAQDVALFLDGIADAGNAGTILRTAVATGLQAVIFVRPAVDPYSGKTVRSGMGAHFRLAVLEIEAGELQAMLHGFDQVLAADPKAEMTFLEVDWGKRTAIVIGSEAHGIRPEVQPSLTTSVRIPMATGVESLNAAVVAAILLYEARRPFLSVGPPFPGRS